jgi:ABC-type nitrate/sulfonate/bicarbonate transport system substrate-binding protein
MHMLGMASEAIGSDPATKPVVLLQLSWSAGDHIVARGDIKNLNDLKGKKIAVQEGGPHVGLLYDSLSAAQLDKDKDGIEIVWTKNITGPDGPAQLFRKDPSIHACCVITPDMIGLTGGLNQTGSGAEGTVQGARVINSTAQMSRSIADVIAVRSDWYAANTEWCKKYVAGYLAATESLVAMRRSFEETHKMSKEYKDILTLSQRVFGNYFLPTLEVDAHGLLLDCVFTGLPGQMIFFNDSTNLSNFDHKMSDALDLASKWGYVKNLQRFELPKFSNDVYEKEIAKFGNLKYVAPTKESGNSAESTDTFLGDNLDDNTIVSFAISFKPNQTEFPIQQYGADFMRALKSASTFGNARVVIRGHADPTKTLIDLVKAGMAKKIIQQNGVSGNYKYYFQGKELRLEDTKRVVDLIKQGAFSGGDPDPNVTMQAALSLSKARADQVMKALENYAKQSDITLDLSQIAPVGAGISEPLIAKPKNITEAEQNMRVEFRIVKVNAEALAPTDFNF